MIEPEAASQARRMADLGGARQVGFSPLVTEQILYQSLRAPGHWETSGAASRNHLCLPVRRKDPSGRV
jgi:hypothetical protein